MDSSTISEKRLFKVAFRGCESLLPPLGSRLKLIIAITHTRLILLDFFPIPILVERAKLAFFGVTLNEY